MSSLIGARGMFVILSKSIFGSSASALSLGSGAHAPSGWSCNSFLSQVWLSQGEQLAAKQIAKQTCNTVASSHFIADSMPAKTRKQLCNKRLLTASVDWDLRAVCGPPYSAVLESPITTSKVSACNKILTRESAALMLIQDSIRLSASTLARFS